jgi:hypothetical protein
MVNGAVGSVPGRYCHEQGNGPVQGKRPGSTGSISSCRLPELWSDARRDKQRPDPKTRSRDAQESVGTSVTARQRILTEMVEALDAHFEARDYGKIRTDEIADVCLRVLERKAALSTCEIVPCTCGHTGYGQHKEDCPLSGGAGL